MTCFRTAADALAAWRDDVLTGEPPELFPVGAGELANFEIGPGRVVLLGGLPGGGKTALSMQFVIDALRAAPTLRALVTNVEMTPGVLLDRQLARLSGVPLNVIAKRGIGPEHVERIGRGIATLQAVADRLAFLDAPYDLANAAAAADEFGARLLVFDYLQRIKPPGQHADRRTTVDALMNHLRQFADAGCGILAISAVARTRDRRGRSSYDPSGLSLASYRESSELEFGADGAYLLVPHSREAVTLRCLKHRHGEPRDIPLHFDRPLQSFAPGEPEPPATPAAPKRDVLDEQLRALWNSTPAVGSA